MKKKKIIAWGMALFSLLGLIVIGKAGFDRNGPKYWDFIHGAWLTDLIPLVGQVIFGMALALISGGKRRTSPNKVSLCIGLLIIFRELLYILNEYLFVNGSQWLISDVNLWLILSGHYYDAVITLVRVLGGFLTVNGFYGKEE